MIMIVITGFCEFRGPRRSGKDARRAHLQREDRQEVHGKRHGDHHRCHHHGHDDHPNQNDNHDHHNQECHVAGPDDESQV